MSKITFRADEELVERMEALDTSKSEAMRDALRRYLDGAERSDGADDAGADESDTVDDALRARIDELVRERVDAMLAERFGAVGRPPQDLNVNITVDGASAETPVNAAEGDRASERADRKTPDGDDDASPGAQAREKSCEKCGEELNADDVYCSNCGEKATHRVFCECGDEVRSDWAFCPGCGRRTSAADVLERS